MWGLFSRSRRSASGLNRRFAKLQVEALESRYCLSDGAPVIVGFSASTSLSNVVTFSGTVLGCTATYTLVLEGTQTTNGYTYTVGTQDGSFDFSIQLHAGESGHVSAMAIDDLNETSNTAYCYVGPPQIVNYTASQSYGNVWTFTGTVLAAHPGGVAVTFEGTPSMQNVTATTRSDGTFFVQVQFRPHESGTVGEIAIDQYLNDSPEVFLTVG
jgi:hypothetical protein